ncbi:MAG: hypothetical protein JST02_00850 [Bacteroidetes bacterium]|nr:hypothetical protein [Bacteroidota bacterium]
MKTSLVVALIILISNQSFSQTAAEQTPQGKTARKILMDNGIKTECYTVTQTPQGLIIGSRTESNIPVNYLFIKEKHLNKIDKLERYIVLGYSPVKGDLLLSKYDFNRNGDSMSHEILTYNLETKQFRTQCDFGWVYGSPHYTESYDSIIVIVNEKNSDGIGSHAGKRIVKVK